jgi:hypothetical protein
MMPHSAVLPSQGLKSSPDLWRYLGREAYTLALDVGGWKSSHDWRRIGKGAIHPPALHARPHARRTCF